MRLKLNVSKTELNWFDRKPSCDNETPSKIMNIEADSFIVPSKLVSNLVVLIEYQLTMINHISSVTRACYFHHPAEFIR